MNKKLLLWTIGLIGAAIITVSSVVQGKNTDHPTTPISPGDSIPAALINDLEKYVKDAMQENDVPGVSMVLVQGDQVIYVNGFGVRDLETKEPVTPDTLMGIGSVTKSMTAVMIGILVDQEIIAWETPVTDIFPTFSLSNPEITQQITFKHMLCMCTGLPRRMEEISFQYNELSPEDIIESLAKIPLSGSFERSFNYSSRMLSAGGYIATMAAGGEYGDLGNAYARIMQKRVFDPLGMSASTFSIQEAMDSGNYATPYYSGLAGYHAIQPEIEGIFTPIAPAGALWSNANDMGKYLIMLLNEGVSGNGERIISAETLKSLWEPLVNIDGKVQYGLGWHVENYNGLTVIHHPGGTAGFASELVIIPELNVGFAFLTNRLDMITPLGRMATYRLLELLTGSEHIYDKEVDQTKQDAKKQLIALSAMTKKTVEPDEITPFLGKYQNEILGNVELILHEDRTLWIDVGEYEIPIRPLRTNSREFILYESIFIGKTLNLEMNPNGKPQMVLAGDEATYQFETLFENE